MSNLFCTRRAWLGSSALGAAALTPRAASAAPSKSPRQIIFMVSDGMSAGVLPLADRFSRMVRGRPTHWAALLRRRDVAHGLFDMASLNSPVTDSAAASSSWGSGVRIFNAMINTLPDGRLLTPLAKLVKDRGCQVGLVTTATVTHATPAGFAACEKRRDDEHQIAPQYLQHVDVILGGGAKFFDAASRQDRTDLWAEFKGRGYALARHSAELAAAPAGKLLGLFSPSHVPYTIDRLQSPELNASVPTLAAMTEAALARLSASRAGFLLQVEGARVDHAAHNNDIAALLWDQLEFDDAIGAALNYQRRNPGALIVLTSDHGNANPGLNGTGAEYKESAKCFDRLRLAKASFDVIAKRLGGDATYAGIEKSRQAGHAPTAGRIIETVEQSTGIRIEPREAEALIQCVAQRPNVDWSRQQDNTVGVLGQILGNHNGVGWTGTSHTSDFTTVTALGAGAADFSGLLPNTAAFDIITRAFGIRFQNPSVNPEEAATFAASLPAQESKHWV